MKATETLNELRTMDTADLDARLKEVRTELFNLRFQAATGQLENHRQIRNVRRQIAQVLTVLQGRRLGIEEIVSAEAAAAVPAPARGADTAQAAAAASATAVAEADADEAETEEAEEDQAGDATEAEDGEAEPDEETSEEQK
jgi:large subunit ribosomal protein L29